MFDDDITPAGVIRETWRWFPAAVVIMTAVLLLGGLVTLVCWQAGWWFASHDVNRQNQLYQNSYGTQQADIQTMQDSIGAIASAADSAQVKTDVNEACQYAGLITSIPPADAGWVRQNCLAGAMSPDSPYAK